MMSTSSSVPTCAPPPHLAWASLKCRSIVALVEIAPNEIFYKRHAIALLNGCTTLEDFLPRSACPGPMLWFFQIRGPFLSQTRMSKWSSTSLDGYVLLPATDKYVTPGDCFFLSHFRQTREDPDPRGDFLRKNQALLSSQSWKYIWVD